MKPTWLYSLASHLQLPGALVLTMGSQLGRSFRELTGLDVARFPLAPTGPEMFRLRRAAGVSSVEAFMVTRDLALPVTIAWRDRDGGGYDVWWQQLPVGEILDTMSGPAEVPFDLDLSYVLDYDLYVWPHARLIIESTDTLSPARVDALQALFTALGATWNDDEATGGVIHSIGEVCPVDDRRAAIDIDFGSAPAALERALRELDELGGVASVRVEPY